MDTTIQMKIVGAMKKLEVAIEKDPTNKELKKLYYKIDFEWSQYLRGLYA